MHDSEFNKHEIYVMLVGVVAELFVMWLLPNLGMGDHSLNALFDGVSSRLVSLRPISSKVLITHYGGAFCFVC
jgi:hypothetical protein